MQKILIGEARDLPIAKAVTSFAMAISSGDAGASLLKQIKEGNYLLDKKTVKKINDTIAKKNGDHMFAPLIWERWKAFPNHHIVAYNGHGATSVALLFRKGEQCKEEEEEEEEALLFFFVDIHCLGSGYSQMSCYLTSSGEAGAKFNISPWWRILASGLKEEDLWVISPEELEEKMLDSSCLREESYVDKIFWPPEDPQEELDLSELFSD